MPREKKHRPESEADIAIRTAEQRFGTGSVFVPPAAAAGGAAPAAASASDDPPVPARGDVDAVSAEGLHPTKRVSVTSPDGSLRLWYNTSTLIRIAQTKGRWLQPPHFREDMKPDLVDEVIRVEGRRVEINIALYRDDDDDEIALQGIAETVLDVHYLLEKRELYACPDCFAEARKRLGHRRQPCPLDVLGVLDPATETPFVVFANAKLFREHMKACHGSTAPAGEHKVRDFIHKHLVELNAKANKQMHYERNHSTTQRYWFAHTRFNTMRYNELFAAVQVATLAHERGEDYEDLTTKCVFLIVYEEEDADVDDNFIASSDDDDGRVPAGRWHRDESAEDSDVEVVSADGDVEEMSLLQRLEAMDKLAKERRRRRREAKQRAAEATPEQPTRAAASRSSPRSGTKVRPDGEMDLAGSSTTLTPSSSDEGDDATEDETSTGESDTASSASTSSGSSPESSSGDDLFGSDLETPSVRRGVSSQGPRRVSVFRGSRMTAYEQRRLDDANKVFEIEHREGVSELYNPAAGRGQRRLDVMWGHVDAATAAAQDVTAAAYDDDADDNDDGLMGTAMSWKAERTKKLAEERRRELEAARAAQTREEPPQATSTTTARGKRGKNKARTPPPPAPSRVLVDSDSEGEKEALMREVQPASEDRQKRARPSMLCDDDDDE